MLLKAQYPFQCIRYASGFIVASAGPNLYSFSAIDGSKRCVWPESKVSSLHGAESEPSGATEHSDEPPEKRRKISSASAAKDGQQATGMDSSSTKAWSFIPIIATSPTSQHVVAVTAEDKHIRVFSITSDGVLTQLNARPAPKKLCSVKFTSDGNTLICADKAGDVYSIPLLGNKEHLLQPPRARKQFQPAANELVVHSLRNLESLRQQQLQQERGDGARQPSEPTMRKDTLLGHVSLLTDMDLAYLPSTSSSTGSRGYILTADRDEQVRVSRGPPQTHITEAFCLGHESFVSTLCVPATMQHLLISGGGDDSIFVWDWKKGQNLHKERIASELGGNQAVVRGIWATNIANSSYVGVFVALEGSSELLSFLLESSGKLTAQSSIHATGNILCVAVIEDNGTILLSVDPCHEPSSTTTWRSNFDNAQVLVEDYGLSISDGKINFEPKASNIVKNINAQGTEGVIGSVDELSWPRTQKSLSEALYNLNNLRKRS